MNGAFDKIIGKTISGFLCRKNKRPPELQLFLVFDDGTYFEMYGHGDLTGAKGLDRGTMEDVKHTRFPDGVTLMAVEEGGEDEEGSNTRTVTEDAKQINGSVIITLGTPGDDTLLPAYQRFQELGVMADEDDPWVQLENKMIIWLFSRENGPSVMDELVSSAIKQEVEMNDYTISIGYHRGQWATDIVINPVDVSVSEEGESSWPPSKQQLDLVSLTLMSLLKREWVGAMVLRQ